MLLLATLEVGALVGKVVGGSCLVTAVYAAVWEASEPVATLPAWTTFVPAGPAGRPLVAATTTVGAAAAVVGPYLIRTGRQTGKRVGEKQGVEHTLVRTQRGNSGCTSPFQRRQRILGRWS